MHSTRDRTEAALRAWGAGGSVRVSDPQALEPALRIATQHLARLARVADRRLPDAEVHRLPRAAGAPVDVSSLLARVVEAALRLAQGTDGLVDPTVPTPRRRPDGRTPSAPHGIAPQRLALPTCGAPVARPARGWHSVQLSGARLTVPAGTTLDLRVAALGTALDDIALVATQLTGADVSVVLGGRGARVGAGHAVSDPAHVLDPRTGRPAPSTWRSVEVSARTCRDAGALAVAAAVLGEGAPAWLERRGASARLTAVDGSVVRIGTFEPVAQPALAVA